MPGGRIKEFRKSRNLTVREFAEKCGISYTNLSNIENGKVIPTKKTLMKIAEAFDIKINDGEIEKDIVTSIANSYIKEESDLLFNLIDLINDNYCGKDKKDFVSKEFYFDVRGLVIDLVKNRINYYANKKEEDK